MNFLKKIVDKFYSLKTDKLFGEVFSGSILVFAAKIVATLLGLATSVIVARYYGADVVGVVALINSYFSIAMIFTLMGTNTSILRLVPEYQTKYSPTSAYLIYKKIRSLVIGLSVFLGILLFFSSGVISDLLTHNHEIKYLFMIASFILVFKTLQTFSLQGIRAVQRIKAFAFVNIITPILYFIFLVIATVVFYHKYNPVYIQFLLAILVSIISLVIIQKTFSKIIKKDDELETISLKKVLKISFPMFLTASIMIIGGQMANIFIGIFRTESDVGFFSIAFKLASLTIFILQAINTTIAPKFSELYYKDKIQDLFTVAKKSTKLIFWGTLPLLTIFTLFGKWIIVYLYGAEFEVSYYLLLIITIGMLVGAVTGSVGYFLNMCGNEITIRNVSFISLIIGLITCLILIPYIGVYGAAIAAALSQSFRNIILTIIIYKKFNTTFIYFPFISK